MNYSELSQAVSDWLNKDSIDKIVPTIIRFAQQELENNLRIRPMEYVPTPSTLTAGSADLDIPDDYLELKYLNLIRDNTRYPVEYRIDIKELISLNTDLTESDTPSMIARVGDSLIFDVLSDVDYTLDWCYYRRLPTLVASAVGSPPGNSNWWSVNAEEAFLMTCLVKAGRYVSGITAEDKKKWKDASDDAIEQVRLKDNQESYSGVVLRSEPFKI